ncbi:MAG: hypothetical protein ACUVXI_00580 [bacterium]
MLQLNERYVVDGEGRKIAVLIDIDKFNELMETFNNYEAMATGNGPLDYIDLTERLKSALMDIKEGRVRPVEELMDEL